MVECANNSVFIDDQPYLVSINGGGSALLATWPTRVVYESLDCTGPAYLEALSTPGLIRRIRVEESGAGDVIWYPASQTSVPITARSYRSGVPVCTGMSDESVQGYLATSVTTPFVGPYRPGRGTVPLSAVPAPAVRFEGLTVLALALAAMGIFVLRFRRT